MFHVWPGHNGSMVVTDPQPGESYPMSKRSLILLQSPAEDRRGMTSVWLDRGPSVAEFMSHPEEPEYWNDRPVMNMPLAYMRAASVLLEGMISMESQTPGSANALLPPYLFLRRHHIEIQLKRILETVSEDLSKWNAATGQHVAPNVFTEVSRSHGLKTLWEQVRPMAETVLANETPAWHFRGMTLADVSDRIGEFDSIDPRGDGARYDRDTAGNPTMLGINRVDLEHTEDNMQRIAEFLHWAYLEIG